MGPTGDPWSSGGEHTRSEVRDIFALHAERGAGADRPAGEEERHRPLGNVLGLPARIWRALPRGGKIAVGALLAGLAVLLVLLVPPALDNAGENRENQRRSAAANLERIRLALVEDQRPRRASLPLPVNTGDLEAAVGADYERRVRAGDLDGPVGATNCRPIRRPQERDATVFTCLARQGSSSGVYGDRKLVTGYRFRARVVNSSGAAAWCKENPRPLHPDQEEFVVVPLSRACTG
jgi:hypothetical protein